MQIVTKMGSLRHSFEKLPLHAQSVVIPWDSDSTVSVLAVVGLTPLVTGVTGVTTGVTIVTVSADFSVTIFSSVLTVEAVGKTRFWKYTTELNKDKITCDNP